MSQPRSRKLGFTLIEILVVLVIVGLLTGIALPRMNSLYKSVENSSQRNAIRDQIESLGYLAYAGGKAITLESTAAGGEAAKTYPLPLPPGWRVDVTKSVRYSSNGICSGGRLVIIDPDGSAEAFRLAPPLCRLEPTEGNAG